MSIKMADYRVLTLISAFLGTTASFFFIERVLSSDLGTVGLWAVAVVMWAPCNFFTAWALRKGSPEKVLFQFALYSTVLDALTGVFVQRNALVHPVFFSIGVAGAVYVAINSQEEGIEPQEKMTSQEVKLYWYAGLFFGLAIILHTVAALLPEQISRWNWAWYSTLSAVVEYAGGVLLARWMLKREISLAKETYLSSAAFTPMTLVVIFLFQSMPNLAIAGPLGVIENGVIPFFIAATLLKKRITLGEWITVLVGVCSVLLIFFSF